jgi:hypothetical protein
MILSKIIYDVREQLKLFTDDSEIDDRYIVHLFNIKRAKYLRQELNNYQRTTDISVKQTLCLGLERVSTSECNLDYECEYVMRTVRKIPQPLELHIKSGITSVRPTNRIKTPFNFITKEKAIYSKDSPFAKGIFSFLDADKHIYLLSADDAINMLECITITGVFEDPLELSKYTNCCSCTDAPPCFDELESEYPLQPHYIDLIKSEIIKELSYRMNIHEDKENDTNDQE